MAAAARRNLNADFGIGITGIAGNDEVEGKPPGTMHIAVAGELGADHISYAFYQGRQATKRRAVTTALFLLRRTLLAREG
jgi:nicotinamide mononucleotide (NMN) deamidase PncC